MGEIRYRRRGDRHNRRPGLPQAVFTLAPRAPHGARRARRAGRHVDHQAGTRCTEVNEDGVLATRIFTEHFLKDNAFYPLKKCKWQP